MSIKSDSLRVGCVSLVKFFFTAKLLILSYFYRGSVIANYSRVPLLMVESKQLQFLHSIIERH